MIGSQAQGSRAQVVVGRAGDLRPVGIERDEGGTAGGEALCQVRLGEQDLGSGKAGKTVTSRSGRNLPPHRPRKIFDREAALQLRRQGRSYRQIATSLGLGLGTVVRTLQECSKSL